jgi:hypothetical protein
MNPSQAAAGKIEAEGTDREAGQSRKGDHRQDSAFSRGRDERRDHIGCGRNYQHPDRDHNSPESQPHAASLSLSDEDRNEPQQRKCEAEERGPVGGLPEHDTRHAVVPPSRRVGIGSPTK